jgi:hypothetical protein
MLVNMRSYYQDGAYAGSMRYAIKNAATGTTAAANFFVYNNLGQAMRMGIRCEGHQLGQGNFIVGDAGQMIFGNTRRDRFVWSIDMTDSTNIYNHNNWPMMVLVPQMVTSNAFLGIGTTNPLAMLDVRGNISAQQITSTNSFRLSNNGYSNNEHITYGTTTNLIGILNTNLQGQISNNSNITYNANTNLSARINAETNRAIVAEGVLDGKINTSSNTFYTIATNLQEQINIETNRASVAETNLSNRINIETNRAIVAEGALDGKINTSSNTFYTITTNLQNQISVETNRAIQAELGLTNAIVANYTNLNNAINTETNRAYVAETNLSNRINTETNRAITAEAGLTNAIVANYTNLNNAINAETNRAYVAETNLSDRINTETNRAISAETNIQGQVTSATNRIANIESKTNAWDAVATSSKFYANMGTTFNQTFTIGASPQRMLNTNLLLNVGGVYSNTAARWIPGVSNVLVKIIGELRVNMNSTGDTLEMFVRKNGAANRTVLYRRCNNAADDWASSFNYVDITTNAADYYEVWVTVIGNNIPAVDSGSANWWSGQIIY